MDAHHHTLVVGRGPLAAGVAGALEAAGGTARRLRVPVDRDLRRALDAGPQAVVVVDRNDISALRTALLVGHLRPGIHLTVTIFDRTVAEQVRLMIPNVDVLSMADAAMGAVLGPCLSPELVAVHSKSRNAIRIGPDGLEALDLDAIRLAGAGRARRWISRQLRPNDRLSRLLLASLAALLGLLALEVVLTLAVQGGSLIGELYGATKATATVGPNPAIDEGPRWLQLYASAVMVAGVALLAVFTAALVSRLSSRRLTTTAGARTIPRRDHVVVVGLGQVGFRLCLELRALGVDVVAVERDPESAYVRLARELNLPVVIGRGGDRFVLARLSLSRARALAAVTSEELENIAVTVTALAVQADLRTVLRTGSEEITEETAALFPIGVTCDVQRVAAAALAASALERHPLQAFAYEGQSYIELPDRSVVAFPAPDPSAAAA